jgi:hypothetical protein
MTERERIEAAQKLLGDLKEHLREVRAINVKANRPKEANAAFKALSKLNVWHAETTEDLLRLWPGMADITIAGPGGGR